MANKVSFYQLGTLRCGGCLVDLEDVKFRTAKSLNIHKHKVPPGMLLVGEEYYWPEVRKLKWTMKNGTWYCPKCH